MSSPFRVLIGLFAMAAALAGPAGTALAQNGSVSFVGTGWQVQCNNDGTALACAVVQQIARNDNGAVIAAVSLRLPEGGPAALTVQLPLGILVSAPVTLQVDSGTPSVFSIQTCIATGCFVLADAPETLIAAMQMGTSLTLAFQSVDSQPVTMSIPLGGFSLALEKL